MIEIAGFQSLSLSDYPGCPAAIVFTQGCNFRCPYCHNRALIARGKGQGGADAVLARLAARRELVRGVVITGGEPTLQRGLDEFCRAVQELGLRVKLDTNGSRPETLFRLLHADLVDFVAMDIKAPLDAASYRCLTGVRCDVEAVRESMALLAGSDTQYLLRTTVDRRLLSEADLATIVAALPRGARHVWQECREVEATVPPGVSGRSGRHDP